MNRPIDNHKGHYDRGEQPEQQKETVKIGKRFLAEKKLVHRIKGN
jgi:hypothetical protein